MAVKSVSIRIEKYGKIQGDISPDINVKPARKN